MKTLYLISSCLLAMIVAGCNNNPKSEANNTDSTKKDSVNKMAGHGTEACDSLWKYVYKPERFTVHKKCATVTGVIAYKPIPEADGDYHIRLKLDPGQENYLNEKNGPDGKQHGCLVLEIICKNKVKQADAIEPCKDCYTDILVPKLGDHVKVTGTFVTDNEAGHGWNEIHPVYEVKIIK
jgi:hypothetical protein